MKSETLKKIEDFRRQELKNLLALCTSEQQRFFKRIYSYEDLTKEINLVVDDIPDDKMNWAIQQCENTVKRIKAADKGRK